MNLLGRLSIRHVWIGLTVGAAFIGPASSPLGLPDIYWTLLTGAWMVSNGRLLESDPFSGAPHVAGPVLNVQWLADLIFQGLAALGGLPMAVTGTAAVVAITYAVLLAAAVAASGHLRLSCVAVWLAYILGASNLSPRPQTLAYPIFAVFILAVMRAEWRQDRRLLWLLPPLTALWANLHGSFFTGFALLGCAAAARVLTTRSLFPARDYVITLGACLVASLINPYGVGSLVYVASIGSNPVIRDFVTEWAPTTVSWREGIMFFSSLLVLGALVYRSRVRLTVLEVLLLVVFGYLAWSSVRAIVWWGFLIAPILARLLGGVFTVRLNPTPEKPALSAAILVAVGGLALLSLPWFKSSISILPADKRGIFSPDTPVGVGQYLQKHDPPPGGVLLNNQAWGGYLEWATWPKHEVFLDGRIELHPPQVWFDYLDIVFPSARWRSLVEKYGVGYMVLSKFDNADLIGDMRVEPGWRLDYEDNQAVVFSRTPLSEAP
jgi:hypothetical protein